MTKEQDTIFSQNSFPLIAGLTVAPTYAFLKSGDSYPPPRAATIPTVWLFCVHWLTLLAIYGRVLWLCPSRKAKSHKPLSWAGTTPGIAILGNANRTHHEVPYVPSFSERCFAAPTTIVQSPKQSRTGKANRKIS